MITPPPMPSMFRLWWLYGTFFGLPSYCGSREAQKVAKGHKHWRQCAVLMMLLLLHISGLLCWSYIVQDSCICYEYSSMQHSFCNRMLVPDDGWNSGSNHGLLYVCQKRGGNLVTFMHCWLDSHVKRSWLCYRIFNNIHVEKWDLNVCVCVWWGVGDKHGRKFCEVLSRRSDSITKVTYWPHFLLNAYEERHKASYRGTAQASYLLRQFHSYVSTINKRRYTQQATIGAPRKAGAVCFINNYLGAN